jgi:hypothetical protein
MFTLVSMIGVCAIFSQEVGTDYYGQPITSIFPVLCIDDEGKRVSFSQAKHFIRLRESIDNTKFNNNCLQHFCSGYIQCLKDRENGPTIRNGFGSFDLSYVKQLSPDQKLDVDAHLYRY